MAAAAPPPPPPPGGGWDWDRLLQQRNTLVQQLNANNQQLQQLAAQMTGGGNFAQNRQLQALSNQRERMQQERMGIEATMMRLDPIRTASMQLKQATAHHKSSLTQRRHAQQTVRSLQQQGQPGLRTARQLAQQWKERARYEYGHWVLPTREYSHITREYVAHAKKKKLDKTPHSTNKTV